MGSEGQGGKRVYEERVVTNSHVIIPSLILCFHLALSLLFDRKHCKTRITIAISLRFPDLEDRFVQHEWTQKLVIKVNAHE